jgi:hypothetical protein
LFPRSVLILSLRLRFDRRSLLRCSEIESTERTEGRDAEEPRINTVLVEPMSSIARQDAHILALFEFTHTDRASGDVVDVGWVDGEDRRERWREGGRGKGEGEVVERGCCGTWRGGRRRRARVSLPVALVVEVDGNDRWMDRAHFERLARCLVLLAPLDVFLGDTSSRSTKLDDREGVEDRASEAVGARLREVGVAAVVA